MQGLKIRPQIILGKYLISQGSDTTKVEGSPEEGWTKLPNGLIFQWGNWIAPNGPWTQPAPTATFPIPFPNKCLSVVRENDWHNRLYGNVGINYAIISVSNTGFTFHSDWYYGHYFAIGY